MLTNTAGVSIEVCYELATLCIFLYHCYDLELIYTRPEVIWIKFVLIGLVFTLALVYSQWFYPIVTWDLDNSCSDAESEL